LASSALFVSDLIAASICRGSLGFPRAIPASIVCDAVQRTRGDPVIVRIMTNCAYCGEHASVAIPAIPGQVCMTHALEFWSGLLTYVKDQAKLAEQHETSCVCGMCNNAAAQHPVAQLFTGTWRDLPIQ
jgi:hypothetical protein